MVLEGAAVGEAVDSGFVKKVRSLETSRLENLKRAGLSDQKVAFINRELAFRAAGQQDTASTKQIVSSYAEQRKIVKPQIYVEEARLAKQIQNKPVNQRTSEETRFLRDVLTKSGASQSTLNTLQKQEIEQFYNRENALQNQRVQDALNKKIDEYKERQEKLKQEKEKNKFVNKVIAKIETSLTKRDQEVLNATLNQIRQEQNYIKTLNKSKRGEASKKELQKAANRELKSKLDAFSAKAAQHFTEIALGTVYLARVPELLTTKEGRVVLAVAIASLPSELKTSLRNFGALVKSAPSQAGAILLTEYVTLKGTGEILRLGGKFSKAAIRKVTRTQAFRDLEKALRKNLVEIERGVVRVRKRLPSGRELTLKVGGLAEVKESLARQLAREGKSLVGVTAQADKVIKGIRGRAIVRKPLPFDENKLSAVTRKLLKKFDKGNISADEVLYLNRLLREESKRLAAGQVKGVDLLERSMYFDPDRTLRKSRLALGDEPAPEEGTLFDLLSGRASLFNKKAKPRIYVIEEFAEKLPKTKEFAKIIKKIKKAVKAGQDPNLTKDELAKLTRWQVTKTGKLKPIGSTTFQGGLEREVTIAPGEVIKKVKKLGVLRVGDKKIPIYAIKIIKGKEKSKVIRRIETLNKEVRALRKGKSTPRKKKQLESKLKQLNEIKTKKATKEVKEFLRDTRKRTKRKKKVYPTKRKLKTAASRVRGSSRRVSKKTSRRITPRKRTKRVSRRTTPRRNPRKTTTKTTTRPRPTPRRTPSRRTTPRTTPNRNPPRRPTPRRPGRPTKPTKKSKALVGRSRKEESRKGKGNEKGYNVYIKIKGKYVKANKKPLSQVNAENRRAYILDHSTAATGKLVPVKNTKKLGKIKSKEYGARGKIKSRNYRIVKGKKVPIPDTIIERRGNPRVNTQGEKKQLGAARLIKQLNSPGKKVVRKKTTKKNKK